LDVLLSHNRASAPGNDKHAQNYDLSGWATLHPGRVALDFSASEEKRTQLDFSAAEFGWSAN
jgi:hypothetical protein